MKTQSAKKRRIKRVRAKINGTGERPRLSVLRSNKNISAQAIDDQKRVTIISASSRDVRSKDNKAGKKSDEAREVGKELAKRLIKKHIKSVVFDRGAYLYHGRVKALAEGLREGGITI